MAIDWAAVGRPKAADGNQDGFLIFGDQHAIRDAVEKICARFSDDYCSSKDRDGEFRMISTVSFAEAQAGSASACRKIMAGQGSASPKRADDADRSPRPAPECPVPRRCT